MTTIILGVSQLFHVFRWNIKQIITQNANHLSESEDDIDYEDHEGDNSLTADEGQSLDGHSTRAYA